VPNVGLDDRIGAMTSSRPPFPAFVDEVSGGGATASGSSGRGCGTSVGSAAVRRTLIGAGAPEAGSEFGSSAPAGGTASRRRRSGRHRVAGARMVLNRSLESRGRGFAMKTRERPENALPS
jgi:hypothetical protein